jgi:hypothetical protein
VAVSSQAAPGGAPTPTEGLTAGGSSSLAERNRNHYTGSLVLEGGGNVGVARLADSFAVALESGALTAAISMTRSGCATLRCG